MLTSFSGTCQSGGLAVSGEWAGIGLKKETKMFWARMGVAADGVRERAGEPCQRSYLLGFVSFD